MYIHKCLQAKQKKYIIYMCYMYTMYILHIGTYLQIANMHLCVNIPDYEHIYLHAKSHSCLYKFETYVYVHVHRWWDAPPLMMPVANEGSLGSLLNM